MTKVIVIGGGASGLVAAISAARNGADVIILERNNSVGKKLLLTGNGRCNYWNQDQSLEHYHSETEDLLKEIINDENIEKILDFFNSIGIVSKIKDGYYYPYSNQAISMKASLLNEINSLGIEIISDTFVTNLEKKEDKFFVYTDDSTYIADKVILAMGSKSYPQTGSDGNGYEIAENLGHQIVPVLPSLTQVYGDGSYYKEWNGVRCPAKLSLYENEKFMNSECGELHLTDYGLSGICIFNLSGKISKGLFKNKKEVIYINFLSDFNLFSNDDFIKWLDERNTLLSNRTIDQLFDGILPYKLFYLLLKLAKVDPHSTWNKLEKKQKYILSDLFIKHSVNIIKTNDYKNSQVCSGGISLLEINPKTMESLKVRGLYFAGEILDVDGDCGGYNLSFAWISGMLAGSHAGENHA